MSIPFDTASGPSATSLETAVRCFEIKGTLQGIQELRRGHIHSTFVSTWRVPHSGSPERYLHQRMNASVFEDIPALMHNVGLVTRHMADTEHDPNAMEALRLVRAYDGADYAESGGAPWRTYEFIEGAISYDRPQDAEMAHRAASAFAEFQVRLSCLDPAQLRTTIPDFFNSEVRLRQLDESTAADVCERAESVAAELDFVHQRRAHTSVMEAALREGRMPSRVVHGDTKLNNVLFDVAKGHPRCVVDLDTCMPGYSLYDFGDLVRFTAATAAEDETELDKVSVDLELFGALRDGYMEHAAKFLLPFEVDHMAFAARLVTMTVGMRFLADHIAGDRYFKISRDGQNLDRARVQFRLVEEMERLLPKRNG